MSLIQIAWRSVTQRGLASLLTTVSMALGVMLVVMVLSIHGVVTQQFRNNASLGYNMIVGAKGGKLQLTLNSVYYLSEPIENIDYETFLEFFPEEVRRPQLENSLAFTGHRQRSELESLQGFAELALPGPLGLAGQIARERCEQHAISHLERSRPGRFAMLTKYAIPLCLGDYYGRFRCVGTVPEFFELLADPEAGKQFTFAQGRNFTLQSDQHGYFEAVVGSTVAHEMGLRLGDRFSPSHGAPDGHSHARDFVVVGILSPTGTPNDRAAFVNMEGFYLMEDHAKPVEQADPLATPQSAPPDQPPAPGNPETPANPDTPAPEASAGEAPPAEDSAAPAAGGAAEDTDGDAHFRDLQPLPLEQREVTAVLIRSINTFVSPRFQNIINEGDKAQAVQPVAEIYGLLDSIVRPVQYLLLGLTVMICIVSGISILVSIYNSMNDRKQEIAVMRALGARRNTVFGIILLESLILSVAGGALGWIAAHALNVLSSDMIESRTGVRLGFFDLAPGFQLWELMGSRVLQERFPITLSLEVLLVPGLMLLAVIVGFIPAITAYRTDVSKAL